MFVVVTTEAVNLVVLVTNDSVIEIIMNFLALVVISEFDNFFFVTAKNTFVAKAITEGTFLRKAGENEETVRLAEVVKIQVTTSERAQFMLRKNKLEGKDMEGKPKYIFINFWDDRTWGNKIARIVYFFMHVLYVSFFCYFAPFASIALSYAFIANTDADNIELSL